MLNGSFEEAQASSTSVPPINREHLNKVKSTWMSQEDYAVAYKLQEEEFSQHYDKNRNERKQMGGDTKMGKQEQSMEDKYAEEYWEQVRRDREQEDERVARQLQLEMEGRERQKARDKRAHQELSDQEIARRVAEKEQLRRQRQEQDQLKEDARLCAQLQRQRISAAADADVDNRRRPPIELPSGITPEHNAVLQNALNEEDEQLARYLQDREMAKYLQKKQIKKALRRPSAHEQQNGEAAAAGVLEASEHIYTAIEPRSQRNESHDLISFEEEPHSSSYPDTTVTTNTASVSRARAAKQKAELMGVRVLPNSN